MSGDVIVTVTLNAALHVDYTTGDLAAEGINAVSRPSYRAGGRGVTVARVLRAFGHDVLAAGLAGGASGELIREDLAKSGVPTAFTLIRGDSRRFFRFAGPDLAGPVMRFAEPGPYITTEELGRFAADYRRLMAGAAAVVLCGSLPDGLPVDTYGSLVTYAAEAGVPVILDVGGEELKHAIGHGPDLMVAETSWTWPLTSACSTRCGSSRQRVDRRPKRSDKAMCHSVTRRSLRVCYGLDSAHHSPPNLGPRQFPDPSWNGAIVYMWRINREHPNQARPGAAGRRLRRTI